MSFNELPKLANFDDLSDLLESERKTIIKVNAFSEDDEFVRTTEDASIILEFIRDVQTNLWNFFNEYPSLSALFTAEYISFFDFLQRETILDLVFLDDCLMPEKEIFFYGQDGGLSPNILEIHKKSFVDWISTKKQNHLDTQVLLKENFNVELKSKDLGCQCVSCIADHRTRLREFIYDDCVAAITDAQEKIENAFNEGLQDISEIFHDFQKKLDKKFYNVRYRLKRSTLNRLEAQVKHNVEEVFTYPAPLAQKQVENIKLFFFQYLDEHELSRELITEEEYHRFYSTLSRNIWRNERYIEREFKKFVKAIVILKKKDVSSKILQEYLGEFWVHSQAREIKRKIVYHMGPTNSGKTYHAVEALCLAEKGCYLAPLRLLAGELYDTMNAKGVKTTLLTGEEVVEIEGATHYSSTIEMARFQEVFDCVVIDEIQMITDSQRGWAWTRALVNIFASEVHICGDASALEMVQNIVDICGDELEIHEYQRMTKLEVQKRPIVIGDLEKSDALIVFSRRNALKFKMNLEKLGFKVSIVYGRLSPEVRREQARKFDAQETDIIVSTDAIAMGMNLPIRRIVFSTLTKFFDSKEQPISESEIKQIAGRAGRYKRFPTGFVTCLTKVEDGPSQVSEALNMTLPQSKKCMVGPDLDIFAQVNTALEEHSLPSLKLSEFLRLFNTMIFKKPFYCVELKEMIEVAEMVEEADGKGALSSSEIFGFACAPVNLGLLDHVQYFNWILNHYVNESPIYFEQVNHNSNDIDYLETSIKCVELYQWLSRHFNNKHFDFNEVELLENKSEAVSKLNDLLSAKIVPTCSSCGAKLLENTKFAICEDCFKNRKFSRRGGRKYPDKSKDSGKAGGLGQGRKKFNRSKKRKFSGKKKPR